MTFGHCRDCKFMGQPHYESDTYHWCDRMKEYDPNGDIEITGMGLAFVTMSEMSGLCVHPSFGCALFEANNGEVK